MGILTKEENKIFDEIPELTEEYILDYFKSDDGIIRLLCDIPNFSFEDYRKNKNIYTEDEQNKIKAILNLASNIDNAVHFENERAVEKNLPASLKTLQLVGLNLLYFGIKDNGVYVGLEDPYLELADLENDIDIGLIKQNYEKYKTVMIDFKSLRSSGEFNKNNEINDKEKVPFNSLEIEHILNLANESGTILPNCILTSAFANRGSGQKLGKLLINFLNNKNGYNYTKLYTLTDYILSAYKLLFENYDETAGFNKYSKKNSYVDRDESVIIKDLHFVKNVIYELNKKNIGIHNNLLEEKLDFVGRKYVNNWKKINAIQDVSTNWLRENFKKTDDDEYEIIEYSHFVNYYKLFNIFDPQKDMSIEKLCDKVKERFDWLSKILDSNDKNIKFSIGDYFASLSKLRENNLDFLYFSDSDLSKISDKDIKLFQDNLKLCKNGRIDKFIDMISREDEFYTSYTFYIDELNRKMYVPDKNNVFAQRNDATYDGFDDKVVSSFWRWKYDDIKSRLKELLKVSEGTLEHEKYERAQKAIDKYEFVNPNDISKRVDKFIDMISREDKYYTSFDENDIFVERNKVAYEGYEDLKRYFDTSYFWSDHQDEIKKRIDELLEKTLGTEEHKKYERAKRSINVYEFSKNENIDKRIDKFIDMISREDEFYTSYKMDSRNRYVPNENNIFASLNDVAYEGYKEVSTIHFWHTEGNSVRIKKRLIELIGLAKGEEERQKYERAQKAIDKYEFINNGDITKKIEIFIEMINRKDKKYTTYELKNNKMVPDVNNLFSTSNQNNEELKKKYAIGFEGYEDLKDYVNIYQFWTNQKGKIIAMLFENDKYRFNPEYDTARECVMFEISRVRKKQLSYNEYVESLDKSKKEYTDIMKTKKLMQQELENLLNENFELEEELLSNSVKRSN